MPPQTGRKIIFDTNVYINAIHGGAASKPYRLLFDSLPSTHLCSVVSAELYLGALDFRGIRLIQGFVVRSEKVGRVVTPSHGSWNESARILAKISQKEPKYNSKLTALLNDALIALSALQIGATVCTGDKEDFELIRRYKRFALEIIEDGLGRKDCP
jgi:predicted nucleic acid-binding protein